MLEDSYPPLMYIRVPVLSLLLFVAAFGAHEVMHLLLIYAVDSQGALIVRPWHFGYLEVTVSALHAQPAQQLDVVRQLIVNFFGPVLAPQLTVGPVGVIEVLQSRGRRIPE